jgi:UDP-N-acetyl-D-glucosamine dehydrogenase
MTLLERIQSKDCKIGIIGQGYVGLPLALVFVEAGFPVIGLDLDKVKVAALNRGESYIKHIGSERVSDALETGRFSASADFDDLSMCEAVLICVPTPLGPHREPDLSFVLDSSREVAKRLRKGQLVVLESTTYPGTTDEDVLPALEATGLKTPDDFLLAFSPEREDPGNPKFHTKIIPKVVGGVNAPSTEAAVALIWNDLSSTRITSHSNKQLSVAVEGTSATVDHSDIRGLDTA